MNSIIPLYLYSNSLLTPYRQTLSNQNLPNEQNEKVLYVINPDIRPIPIGMDTFCITNVLGKTKSISLVYDVFDIDQNCIRFLAWLENVPNTIKNNVYNKEGELYITNQTLNLPLVTSFQSLIDPEQKFVYYEESGFCVPETPGLPLQTSLSLRDCLILYNKNILALNQDPTYITNQHTILQYLEDRYGKNSEYSKTNKKNIRNLLIIVIIFLIIFIIYKWKTQ
jgi:hypothetical protein